MELLGVASLASQEEKIFELDDEYLGLEHDQLLRAAVAKLEKDSWD
jgi:hypothetical protein